MERESTAATAGNNLSVVAGGAASGGTDLAGGDLILSSGTSTGQGGSNIDFWVAAGQQGPGTTDRAPASMGQISGTNRSLSLGENSAAPGFRSAALGYGINVTGNYSIGMNLSSTATAVSQPNTMAIMGGNVGIGTTSPQAGLDVALKGTASAVIAPRDTTANRPTTPVNGMIRYNTDLASFEGYANGQWQTLIATSSPGALPPGTGGSGFLVETAGTTTGNIGGLAGANTFCRNDLSTNNWKGKPGTLDTSKVFALLCDEASCQNPQALVNLSWAVSGDTTTGGGVFPTDSNGSGPGDSYALTSSDRFGGAAGSTWSGDRAWDSGNGWNIVVNAGGGQSCNNWSSSASTDSGSAGEPAQTAQYRFSFNLMGCNLSLHLICFVNP
jgi:hypothetical protein